jgi:hypothetical protein
MDWGWLVWMNIGTTLVASAVCVFFDRAALGAGAKQNRCRSEGINLGNF